MDLRFALRTLRRTPGFTAAAVVSLALGIGANTAIFSVVNAVLLRPLDYTDPGRLVVVGHGGTTVSAQTFLEWRARIGAFERIGAAEFWTPNLAGAERTDQLYALHLSSDVLPLLGVEPLVGRMFSSDEEHAGRDRVVVLGHALWNTRFAADPHAVGTAITLDGERYTIVGVMPERFRFAPFWATKAQLWAPLVLDARTTDKGGSLRIFARLKPDVSLTRARAELTALTAALDEAQGAPNVGATITPLHDMVAGDVKPALLVLLTATGLVLLIACANVAHLQLVRGAGRARGLAVRTALGASRGRVVRQLLTESAILCAVGAGAGVLIAYEGLRVLVALGPWDLPRIGTVSMDARVLYFTFGVTACAGLLSGLMPAVRSARVNVNESLKSGGRGSSGGDARTALRGLLVVSEFAMAMVLLVSAALVLRSFFGLLAVDSGFDPRNVVAMDVSVAGTSSADPPRRPVFFRELLARVRALPGVQFASAINHLPLVGDLWRFSFAVEGRPLPRPEETPSAAYRVVLPGYFQTMGIPLVKGRDITDRDVLSAPHVVVVNEFTARRYFPNEEPIGRRIAAGSLKDPDWCTVVGVVKDVKRAKWDEADAEELYFPYLQTRLYLESSRSTYLTLVARTSSNATALLTAADNAVRALEPRAVVTNATTMERAIAQQFVAPRFYMLLLGVFAGVALSLATVGIYGVISHSVARRTHEIGVRMALGAGGGEILRMVVGGGLRLAAAGSALGCAGALASTRYLRTLLYGIDPIDAPTFALVGLVLMAVALVACYLPGRRAVAVDPMAAVRCE